MALPYRLSPVVFWRWFARHEDELFHFERNQEQLSDAMAKALGQVNPNLTFEIGAVEDGRREFVISADGKRKAFPAVERLAAAAPPLARWVVTKFRPRMRNLCAVAMGDVKARPEDVTCAIISNGRQLGLYVFIKGYSRKQEGLWEEIGYLFLDQALGEHDVETKVGLIEVLPADAKPDAPRIPIAEVPGAFDRAFARLAGDQN